MLVACPWMRNGERVHLDAVTIDCGYQMDTVFKFCKHKSREGVPFKLIPSRGSANKTYRQSRVIGRPGTGYHVTEFSGRGRVLVHNSDYWRMQTQKMFLLPVGAPGGMSIYGKDHPKQRELADHITAERLVEYYKGATQDMYSWTMPPGRRNDLLDALVGAVVACHYMGARPAGIPQEKPKRAPRRRNKSSVTKI
jgi:phage terminase large subunit GpA-like protein